MSNKPFVPPAHEKSAFNCPHCSAYANQVWATVYGSKKNGSGFFPILGFTVSVCVHCGAYGIWRDGGLLYPHTSTAPLPNPDLPDEIRSDFEEARSIINPSPRGAAALLRLCIQKLCGHLGASGKNLNDDIASFVERGLSPKIQKSLDIVRVIGNEAVHPGTVDLKDDTGTAVQLCNLINIITDAMITQPRTIDELFDELPEKSKQQIEQRDTGNTNTQNNSSASEP